MSLRLACAWRGSGEATPPVGPSKPSLHCLSAFCPLASPRSRKGRWLRWLVSIAFRRSAPWLQQSDWLRYLARIGVSIAFRRSAPWLPASSGLAFRRSIVVSIAFRRSAPWLRLVLSVFLLLRLRLHCLSAFCPLASGRRLRRSRWRDWRVSIAFRHSAPWLQNCALSR